MRLSDAQIAELVCGDPAAGTLEEAATWVAVVLAESGGDPVAYNLVDHDPNGVAYLSTDNGLFQINSYWHGRLLPVHHANQPAMAWPYAWRIATGNGTHPADWSPWTAYKNGAYREYLDRGYAAALPWFVEEGSPVESYPYDVTRSDWEQPGWTIDEHTSSPPLDWSRITNVTVHYPGAVTVLGEPSAGTLISHLRAAQRSYVNSRGYSYGYNAVVWGGVSGEVRGDTYRCAANGTNTANTSSFAVQVRVPGQSPDKDGNDTSTVATDADVAEVRRIVAWCEAKAGRPLEVVGHRDHKPTGCPGDAMYDQVEAGVFDPVTTPPTPPPEVEAMFRFRHVDYADQFSCGASGAMHMTPGILEHYDHLPLVENDDREWLIHCCNDSGFDFARLTPL